MTANTCQDGKTAEKCKTTFYRTRTELLDFTFLDKSNSIQSKRTLFGLLQRSNGLSTLVAGQQSLSMIAVRLQTK